MTGQHRHSVLLVEDEPETRERLARIISDHPRLVLKAAVSDCGEALRRLTPRDPPDVLLTDLGLPDGHGTSLIRAARRLRTARGEPPLVLVISVFGEESTVVESVRAGASGYVLKDGQPAEVTEAVVAMIEGGSPLSAAVARHVLKLLQEPAAQPAPRERAPKLSQREIEVLELLGRGFTSAEIGDLLGISHHTVVAHTRNIHKKLEVSSRSAAIFEALSLGIIRL